MNKSDSKKTYLLINFLSILILMLLIPNKHEAFDNESNIIYISFAIINIICFFLLVGQYIKSWLRFDVLFIIGYIIVHFQIPFLASIGIEPRIPTLVWINKSVVNYATWLSAIAILTWMLGFALNLCEKSETKDSVSILFITSKLDFFLSILMFLFLFSVGKDFLSGVHDGGQSWGSGSNYVFVLLQASLYVRIIYFFSNNRKLRTIPQFINRLINRNLIFFSILVTYLLVFLLNGDRGPIMFTGIIILGAYSVFITKIRLRFLLTVIFLGSFFFTIIAFGRTREGNQEGNIFSRGISSYKEADLNFNPTEELSYSIRNLYVAIDEVPDTYNYFYGKLFLADVFNVFPFGQRVMLYLLGIPIEHISSAFFFTVLTHGDATGAGEGSEILADIFLNFGTIGVFLIMFLMGFVLSHLSYKSFISRSHIAIIVYLVFLICSISLSRDSLLSPMKILFWVLILDFIFSRSKMYQ